MLCESASGLLFYLLSKRHMLGQEKITCSTGIHSLNLVSSFYTKLIYRLINAAARDRLH